MSDEIFGVFQYEGFDWDKGNVLKNLIKHNVNQKECEEVFTNKPLIIFPDIKHSQKEERFGVLGITNNGRKLTMTFCIRKNKVRIITSRDQNKTERRDYEKIKTAAKV